MHKSTSALIVIDAQEGFRNQYTEKVIPHIISAIRTHSGPVLCTRFINQPGSNFERLLAWSEMMSGPKTELLVEIRSFVKDSPIFIKSGYSAFCSSEFCAYLRRIKIQTIKLCGFDTDACVLATAISAFDAGYAPRLLEKASSSGRGADFHRNAVDIFSRNFGVDSVVGD